MPKGTARDWRGRAFGQLYSHDKTGNFTPEIYRLLRTAL